MKFRILKSGGYIDMPNKYPFDVDVQESDVFEAGIDVAIEELISNGADKDIGSPGDKLYFYVPGEAEPIEQA